MKNTNKLGLWVILISATLTVMAGAVIAPVLNLIREGVGADPASVGLIITIHALFIAIFSPFVGMLIDKFGTKKLFISGLLLYGMSGGAGIFITSFWTLLISRAFLGIATAAIFSSITVMILNLYEGEERNKVMGWRGSANSIGGVIWPLIGGFIGLLSWHLPFAIYLISIPLGLVAIFVIPETHITKQETKDKTSIFKVFKDNPILLAIFGLLFWNFVLLYTIVVFLPQKLEIMGLTDPSKIALFISVLAIASAAVSLVYAKIREKLSYKTIILIALLLWAIGFIAISQSSTILPLVLAAVLFGLGMGMTMPALMILIGEKVDSSYRGRVMSYAGTFTYLGQFASPIIWGPALLVISLNEIFLISGIMCLVFFGLFYKFMGK